VLEIMPATLLTESLQFLAHVSETESLRYGPGGRIRGNVVNNDFVESEVFKAELHDPSRSFRGITGSLLRGSYPVSQLRAIQGPAAESPSHIN
jgi:hypothetical protein